MHHHEHAHRPGGLSLGQNPDVRQPEDQGHEDGQTEEKPARSRAETDRDRPGETGHQDADDGQFAVVGEAEMDVAPGGREESRGQHDEHRVGSQRSGQGGHRGQGRAGDGGRTVGWAPVQAQYRRSAIGPRRHGHELLLVRRVDGVRPASQTEAQESGEWAPFSLLPTLSRRAAALVLPQSTAPSPHGGGGGTGVPGGRLVASDPSPSAATGSVGSTRWSGRCSPGSPSPPGGTSSTRTLSSTKPASSLPRCGTRLTAHPIAEVTGDPGSDGVTILKSQAGLLGHSRKVRRCRAISA